MKTIKCNAVIAGCGVAGLFCALHLPEDWQIILLSKAGLEESDSFLAQGGICVLTEEADYESYYHDTMQAGHFENDPDSVELMIRSSPGVIRELLDYGVDFERKDGCLCYTREGAHSRPRILFHQDITGQEITSRLLSAAKKLDNLTFFDYTEMTDLLIEGSACYGMKAVDRKSGEELVIFAPFQMLATGGIGGRYENSTNFPHLTGDALRLAEKYGIQTQNLDYVQIHPTTLYSAKKGRRFLISESVRGEGAQLLDNSGQRFVNELLPRDVVTDAIREKMAEEGSTHVWLDMRPLGRELIISHFPNIRRMCLEEGYDPITQPIPVVPAQHYFMGGIKVDLWGQTSVQNLFAAGETCCNNVHGKNRLASNSLLESLVWAERAAEKMISIQKGE